MPVLRHGSNLIYFSHIPKTGGSSVECYMRQKGTVFFHSKNLMKELPTRPQHFNRKLVEAMMPTELFDHSFAIVRDPLDRLISEYNWLSEGKRSFGAGGRFVPSLLGQHKELSFDTWVNRVFRAYRTDPFVNDNHIRRQIDFIGSDMTLFRFEDGLDKVFDWIDAFSDGKPGNRAVHEKKNTAARPPIDEKTMARVRKFYAKDYLLIEELGDKS